jgi:hypothetical protein
MKSVTKGRSDAAEASARPFRLQDFYGNAGQDFLAMGTPAGQAKPTGHRNHYR